MTFNLATVLVFLTGGLAGVVAALKIIAPRTKNTIDDEVEEYAEKALDLLQGIPGAPPVDAAKV